MVTDLASIKNNSRLVDLAMTSQVYILTSAEMTEWVWFTVEY